MIAPRITHSTRGKLPASALVISRAMRLIASATSVALHTRSAVSSVRRA
jgi:hypothetical protein